MRFLVETPPQGRCVCSCVMEPGSKSNTHKIAPTNYTVPLSEQRYKKRRRPNGPHRFLLHDRIKEKKSLILAFMLPQILAFPNHAFFQPQYFDTCPYQFLPESAYR